MRWVECGGCPFQSWSHNEDELCTIDELQLPYVDICPLLAGPVTVEAKEVEDGAANKDV